MRIYLYDDQRVSTGEHVDIEDLYAPVPAYATHVQPPETVGDEVAHWNGKVWTVLPERPPAPEPEPVPASCTPAQGLVALFAVKQITEDQLLAAIGQIADPVQQYTARIGLQRATTWERGSPTMQAMAALLGLTEQDLDDLYKLAVTVEV